ncbi:MAG: phage major tail tube protein [Desulfobacterales bacterium]|nr:phage major tail tube protein [Desulfobacterales bacterium]
MLPKKIKNWTAFVDGYGYAGKVEDINPPKLALKMEEYRAGGMDMPVELEMGMEKMEASMTFTEYNEEIFGLFGLVDGNAVAVTFRGAREDDSGTDAVIISMRGGFRELDPGTWKAGDKATLKAAISCRYYQKKIAGAEIVEIDVENMIRKIKGVDQLAAQRQALGI